MGEALELAVDEFNGKYFINEDYRPLAEKLRAKFRELQHVPVKHILFLENREDKRKKAQHYVFARCQRYQGRCRIFCTRLPDTPTSTSSRYSNIT